MQDFIMHMQAMHNGAYIISKNAITVYYNIIFFSAVNLFFRASGGCKGGYARAGQHFDSRLNDTSIPCFLPLFAIS